MKKILKVKQQFINTVRHFFDERDYTEVFTAILQPSLLPEPAIRPFTLDYNPAWGEGRKLGLIPSPEISMKKLLANDSGDIYQISPSFRYEEEETPWHAIEFTMLEWYGVGSTEKDNRVLIKELFEHIPSKLNILPIEEYSMNDLFLEYGSLNLEKALINDPITGLQELHKEAGVNFKSTDDAETLFTRLLVDLIEPHIIRNNRSILIYDYPTCVPTLAKKQPNPIWGKRWEIYINGVEIANCFEEENSPENLKEYFTQNSSAYKKAYPDVIINSEFIELWGELPPCSGVALGIDRLMAIALGYTSINRTKPFV